MTQEQPRVNEFPELKVFIHDQIKRRSVEDATDSIYAGFLRIQQKVLDEVVAVLEWYDELSPAEKCTVHPRAGSGGSFGIYTLSYKQLYELYLKRKKQ